ncbi:copper transporter [Tepidibacter formicigenes]|uniref:Copper transport outer membrane protein, MctB n=1 Tax=Tepidibacter formicigenes DSM 15518 TaxID=1123349 RepID=A0A1M6L1C0_9FIRM|nr:copper transporter [Tepidibacter formicigenes]SHJ65031.1 Copper transport outer membrane protein, MctB [Tepidibacter formicigenes DSM 15518]
MNVNMKYYITTLGAIFITLGIGILIGFNLNSNGAFTEQQTQIIQDLENRFENIKTENQELESNILNLTKKNENLNKYIENTFDYIIDARLEGKNIGILKTTEDYFYPNVKEFINKAKGNVVFDITIKDKIVEDIDFNVLNQEFNTALNNKEELINYICKVIYEDKNIELLNKFNEKGIIEIQTLNLDYENLDTVILEGGSIQKNESKLEIIDNGIIQYFKNNNLKLLGTERSDVENSYIPFYKQSKISTIDNLDEVMGKISLIMVLEGKTGHFGIKDTADEFTPLEIK